MVSQAAYRIIKRAAILRLNQGEDPQEIVDSYTKLSSEQKEQLLSELQELILPPEE